MRIVIACLAAVVTLGGAVNAQTRPPARQEASKIPACRFPIEEIAKRGLTYELKSAAYEQAAADGESCKGAEFFAGTCGPKGQLRFLKENAIGYSEIHFVYDAQGTLISPSGRLMRSIPSVAANGSTARRCAATPLRLARSASSPTLKTEAPRPVDAGPSAPADETTPCAPARLLVAPTGPRAARIVSAMIRLVNPSKPPSVTDRPLWTLQRDGRRAQAVAREVPGVGLELVITIDGELRSAELYRGGVGLGIAAAEKRQALLDTGWLEVPAPKP